MLHRHPRCGALRALGADPTWEIPSRFDDGYGLSAATVERLAARGVGLLVTVDCGITAVAEVAAARAAGMDVVVTDHHRPGPELPDCPVVHPALGGLPVPRAVRGRAWRSSSRRACAPPPAVIRRRPTRTSTWPRSPPSATSCRCATRTAASSARAWPRWRGRASPACARSWRSRRWSPADVGEQALGFRLGPRINAAGRMQRAAAALELLLTEDEARAAEVARELDLLNRDRREAETRILFAAEGACAPQAHAAAIVVAGRGLAPGRGGDRGLAAGGALAPALRGDRAGRRAAAAARAAASRAYDLHAGLDACAEHLHALRRPPDGGRGRAAGRGDRALPARAGRPRRRRAEPSDLRRRERVDAVVPGGALALELAEELERLRPVRLAATRSRACSCPARGWRTWPAWARSASMRASSSSPPGARARAAWPSARRRHRSPRPARAPQDIVLRLERNRWNGVEEPRIVLRALCETAAAATSGRSARTSPSGRGSRPRRSAGEPAAADAIPAGIVDRRGGGGFAGVVGELITSGEPVLVGVADVGAPARVPGDARGRPRRRTAWRWRHGTRSPRDPRLAEGFDHLVALDPPPGGARGPAAGRDRARAPRLGPGRGGVRARRLAPVGRGAREVEARDRSLRSPEPPGGPQDQLLVQARRCRR